MNPLLQQSIHCPFNLDPNDDQHKGCLNAIGAIAGIIIAFLICACLNSCTSHRSTTDVTISHGTTTVEQSEQSQHVSRQDTSALHTATVSNSSAVESTTADETETETITEQITVTTDSLGRTTTTTNRTTTRQRKATNATTSQQSQQSIVDVWQQYKAYMDSVYQAENLTSCTQWSDSTYHHQDKQVDSAQSTLAKVLRSIWDVLLFFSVAYVIAYILYMVMKYWPEKK